MNEEQLRLVNLLQTAIQEVYQEQRFLLRYSEGDRTGLEQAFVFRTGIYLSRLLLGTTFSDLDLDSEYNKNHGNAKTSRRFPLGLRPDILIHRRVSNDENKLVVEFKGYWDRNLINDINKLEDLTDPNDNYRYLIGVLVIIGREIPQYRYFINGQEYVERV